MVTRCEAIPVHTETRGVGKPGVAVSGGGFPPQRIQVIVQWGGGMGRHKDIEVPEQRGDNLLARKGVRPLHGKMLGVAELLHRGRGERCRGRRPIRCRGRRIRLYGRRRRPAANHDQRREQKASADFLIAGPPCATSAR